ncbi:glycoside hydrolase family 5 protein [Aaosphaeria arxii CBS 175.79]|uniref:Glycoside hydrolase family 5 protein n=1 Tax=Aaosphaeria arxii CBS 175.79 TaxID=1450172 RepID=A0A6A5XHI5_9PLEO|nr:glycoside hydrolase family 5 protein [Aaosphaeria arxii CBS 175.79]KAF2012735.1 glycoside hydrolase family 5 protein [Aaosphaeria arxii CBS 175.79]
MASGFLRVRGNKIVDQNGEVVILRGASLGGSLNMENFMNGYPGTESSTRAAMLQVMGTENYEFFFDRFHHYFFTEKDAEFLKSCGLNSVRVPFSYKHFESDLNPRVLKEDGFLRLDRIVNICSVHEIYVILDMHAVPGCQNSDWHSDNHTSYAAFWDFKDHQDRTVWLWEHIARRYKDNTWVAGYNPLNEPSDSEQVRVAAFYERLNQSIRAIDPNHMFFLDGNTFAMEWKGFKDIVPNSVYSIHDYIMMGFPIGQRYVGSSEQNAKLRQQYKRKREFQDQHGVPIWVGEFGPTYENSDPDSAAINTCRYNLLREQLRVYDEDQLSWSIWLYKDIGVMGMISTSPKSAWSTLLKPFLGRKAQLQVDSFTTHKSERVDKLINDLAEWIDEVSPAAKRTYPSNWDTKQHIRRNTLQTFLATTLCTEFAELFRGKTQADLDELAKSYAFENCVQREELNAILANRSC